jgi:hypothetical protein
MLWMDALNRSVRRYGTGCLLLWMILLLSPSKTVFGQLDQGAITGTVTDPQGAAIPTAHVQLKNVDTNFTFDTQTDRSGVYTFQPVKVGHYTVTVTASGFANTTKTGLELQVNQRLEADLRLSVGSTTQSVEVNASGTPLLQTQDASTGQVMTSRQINDIPLNQRNYVFVAQLATGVNPSNGSRGQGNGDFNANGQRSTENNFILDGVDNNSNSIDFLNAASYVVKPPPDALQEFSIQTADSSAQFGHSAGGVVNATIKSGTNQFHGDVWEYFRNNDLNAPPAQWYAPDTPSALPFHQNQFGGTLGGPVVRNKLFFFVDYEGNRIIQDLPEITGVPTTLMKSEPGNLSQLLTPSLTGQSQPWLVYEPNSGGTRPLGSACGNPQNVMCASEINPVALKLFQDAYPAPNTGPSGQTYNNYHWSQSTSDTTNQVDARVDYNLSATDQVFGRVSWSAENKYVSAPLGPIFDGGATDNDGTFINNAKNAVFSWNHVFSQTLVNQARFAYNWGYFSWFQQSYNNGDLDEQYGLGGLAPYSAALGNGGLPQINVNEFPEIGPPLFQPSPEHQNVYQIIDDATKIHGNHSFKFGVDFQNVRYSVYQPTFGKAAYNFGGGLTSLPGSSFPSGYGIADFFANQMDEAFESSPTPSNLGRWYRSAYFQDDWKVNSRLTLNLGIRYDYFSPPVERHDNQGEFYSTGPLDVPAGGSGVYLLPESKKNVPLDPVFLTDLSEDNIKLQYSSNRSLLSAQHANFAPRVGISYSPTDRLVVRAGFGLYYDGVENLGNYVNLGANYPFDIEQNWFAPSCLPNNCPSAGLKLETGPPSGGLAAPTLVGWDPFIHTPYTMQQNLSVQIALSNSTTATIGYTGSEARHLAVVVWPSFSAALLPPGISNTPYQPFPAFNGNIHSINFGAIENYNSLQAKLERRFSNGLSFLSSYTWSHSLDDSREPLPSSGDGGDRSYNILGLRVDYGNSPYNVSNRFIFTGTYELPFGQGRRYLNKGRLTNILVGGWNSTLLFRTQTGNPFTVGSNTATVNGAGAFPYLIADPFRGGGSPPPSNPTITCPAKVRNRANWYNPCAFADPPAATEITAPITGAANILPYLGSPRSQISGPGYQRIDMTFTKNFKTYESQYLQFRGDIFNVLNTPSWGAPSNESTSSIGGQITGTAFLGNYSPDARFFQLALKYYF